MGRFKNVTEKILFSFFSAGLFVILSVMHSFWLCVCRPATAASQLDLTLVGRGRCLQLILGHPSLTTFAAVSLSVSANCAQLGLFPVSCYIDRPRGSDWLDGNFERLPSLLEGVSSQSEKTKKCSSVRLHKLLCPHCSSGPRALAASAVVKSVTTNCL